MSVNQKHIVMVGVDIGYSDDDCLYEKLEPYMDGNKNLDCMFDGMSGKYVIVGKIINKGDEFEGLELSEESLSNLLETFGEVEVLLRNELNIGTEPKLYSFTHWY